MPADVVDIVEDYTGLSELGRCRKTGISSENVTLHVFLLQK